MHPIERVLEVDPDDLREVLCGLGLRRRTEARHHAELPTDIDPYFNDLPGLLVLAREPDAVGHLPLRRPAVVDEAPQSVSIAGAVQQRAARLAISRGR
jgi:hypothetical protein